MISLLNPIMTCRVKNCGNVTVSEFNYCEEHLCSRFKKNGGRCKKKRLQNKSFCFSHQYFNDKINIFLGIIGIILAIVLSIFGPKLYYLMFGTLEIDFKENEVVMYNGVPAIKVEVLNRLGSPLLYVNGTATLVCENLKREIESRTFKLQGGHDFLGDSSDATFLLSPDPFFVDLIKSKNNECSDAYFHLAEYSKINESFAILTRVISSNLYEDEFGDYEIIDTEYDNSEDIITYSCLKCNVTISIHSSNYKTIEKTEPQQKFTSGSVTHTPFPIEISLNNPTTEIVYISKSGYLCGVNNVELCRKMKEKYKIGINCDEVVGSVAIGRSPFNSITYIYNLY